MAQKVPQAFAIMSRGGPITIAQALSSTQRTLSIDRSKDFALAAVAVTLTNGYVIPKEIVEVYIAANQDAFNALNNMTPVQLYAVAIALRQIEQNYNDFLIKLLNGQPDTPQVKLPFSR